MLASPFSSGFSKGFGPWVDAGGPYSGVGTAPVALVGTVSHGITGPTWSTSGGGTFDDATALETTYTPSEADVVAGGAELTLTGEDSESRVYASITTLTLMSEATGRHELLWLRRRPAAETVT